MLVLDVLPAPVDVVAVRGLVCGVGGGVDARGQWGRDCGMMIHDNLGRAHPSPHAQRGPPPAEVAAALQPPRAPRDRRKLAGRRADAQGRHACMTIHVPWWSVSQLMMLLAAPLGFRCFAPTNSRNDAWIN